MGTEEKGVPVARVQLSRLIEFCAAVFEKAGMPEKDAYAAAKALCTSDYRGVHSQGVMRMPLYAKRVTAGMVNRRPEIKVIRRPPSITIVDGDGGMGEVVCTKAMEVAIQGANETGVSAVAVTNSNHIGSAAYYAMMALEHDQIGIILTSPTAKLIAPWGGLAPLLDNAPFAVAIPAGEECPVVLDMATSVVSRGQIILAAERNESIPEGWAMDRDGNPTTDAHEAAFGGLLMPVGGYKGYGLAVVIEALSGLLTGSDVLDQDRSDIYGEFERRQRVGQFIVCLRIADFIDVEEFKSKLDARIRELRDSKRMKGVERIFVPGEKEFLAARESERLGVAVEYNVAEKLVRLAREIGLAPLPELVLA